MSSTVGGGMRSLASWTTCVKAASLGFVSANLRGKLAPELFELLFVEAMPIQDAVDLARFLVEATISFVKFSVARPKTVGGPIGIAAITKHEGLSLVSATPRAGLGDLND